MITEAIAKLIEGESLTQDEAAGAMADIMEDRATAAQFGAFVTALRLKGETAEELAGMAQVMRQKALRVPTDLPVWTPVAPGATAAAASTSPRPPRWWWPRPGTRWRSTATGA